MKFSSPAVIAASAAHALAWAAWLWVALWPHSYQGVSATPVQVDELGNVIGTVEREVVRHSASFVAVNGLWPLLALFIPVVLTGLALMALLTWPEKSPGRVLVIGGLALALLAFCVLGYLSFGVMYLPASLGLIVATFLFGVMYLPASLGLIVATFLFGVMYLPASLGLIVATFLFGFPAAATESR